jgi:hypothetical protein
MCGIAFGLMRGITARFPILSMRYFDMKMVRIPFMP